MVPEEIINLELFGGGGGGGVESSAVTPIMSSVDNKTIMRRSRSVGRTAKENY